MRNVTSWLLLFTFLFASQVSAQTPFVSKAVKFAESIPVRDMPSVKQVDKEGKEKRETEEEINEKNEIPLKHVDPSKPGTPDASLWSKWRTNQNVTGTNIPNPPSVSFLGLSQPDNASVGFGSVLPPDPTGEAGLNHYVQAVNLTFRIWDKAGNPLVAAKRMSTLFTALGSPASTRDDGDPIVMYDQLADRWIISQFMLLFNPNPHQLIAVSKTGDPTGAYYLYDFVMPNNKFNDYPHFGVWPDGYYMTDNQFNAAGTAFQGAGNFAFDRAKMLVGDPTASYIYFDLCSSNVNCYEGGLLPSDLDGLIPPPIGAPNVFAMFDANEYGGTDAVYLWDFHADFAVPANSTFIQRTGSPLAVPAFDPRTNPSGRSVIPQPGTTARLDAISDRLMYRLAYRNFGGTESLIMNHTVNAATYPTYRAGVRFYQLNRTTPAAAFTIAEAQTFDGGDAENRWMGSGAMNHKGDIALGYSVSSATVNPSIRYAAKLGTDPAGGGLAQGEQTIVAGSGSQTSTSSRWGDYSQMTVDPSDDCSFWYTAEYYSTTSSAGWQTRIAKFNPGPCTVSPRGFISGTITNCSSGLPIENAFVQITGGFARTTAANGTYEVFLSPGTYVATVTGPLGQGYNTVTSGTLTVTNGGTVTFNTCIQGIAIISPGAKALTAENCSPANNAIDPNETVTVDLSLSNIGGANTANLVATLQNTGGVTAAGAAQNYGVVVAGGGAVTRSFSFTAANVTCGDLITATLQLQDGATNLGTITYTFITGGTSTPVLATFSYTGPPVAIPDNNAGGVDIPITVSGAGALVSDLNFRFDPLAGCDATVANTNAAVDHTFLADLIFKLRSPSGTTVTFMNGRGGGGNNICNLLFDDDGAFPSISTLPTSGGVSGNYAPENPFSAFDGQTANGVWTLNVSDNAAIDVGSLRRFSLILSTTSPVCCVCTPPVVTAPTVTQPTCITATGTIVVNATGAGTLEYSVDNGSTYQASNTFSNLVPASYNIKVRVQESPECVAAYAQNPVLLVNPIPPTAGIAVNEQVEFCQGGSVKLYAITEHYLKVLIPQNLIFPATSAVFGPAVSANAVNGNFVYIPDGTASYLGCNPYAAGALTGKVALIDRGICSFVLKVKNAQNAGAVGVIIVNNNPGPPLTMGGSDPTITIPVVMISQADGLTIKNLIANGLVNGMSFSPNTYLWSNGATTQNITATQNGAYTVTITDPNGCPATSSPVLVTVNQLPTCSITSVPSDAVYTGGVPTNLYFGYGPQSTTLQVTASVGGPFTYAWTGGPGLSNYNTSNPVFTPTAEGSFLFTVEVTNSNGCKTTCSITICVLDIRERDKKGKLSGKVFICHAPPLTPTNVQTLAVHPNAVPEHLTDHPGDRLGKCTDVICGSNLPFTTFSEAEVETQTDGFSVKVSPNPSSSGFSIQVISNSNLPVTVRVLDAAGVVRSTSSNFIKGSVIRVGSELKNGTYFAEVIQGDNRKIVKLIKTN